MTPERASHGAAADAVATDRPPVLALEHVTKRFGGVTALAPLSLALGSGTIHGLLGENGAGKSTLVRLIAGLLAPDAGTIAVAGRRLPPGVPQAARAAGVGVVHQDLALVGELSVAENLALGYPATSRFSGPRALARAAVDLAAAHGLEVGDPDRRVDEVAVGTQARIAIVRALSAAPRILILDEPTAVLTPAETTDLIASLRRLRAAGLLVILITHKLEEALGACDALSVLRAGRLVATLAAPDATPAALARLMVGTAPTARARPRARRESESATAVPAPRAARGGADGAPPALALGRLGTAARAGVVGLDRVTLALAPGEIVGVAGVDGNGQEELASALVGALARTGTVHVAGRLLPAGDVAAALRAGIALVPPDRVRDGLAPTLAVWENLLLATPLLARFAPRHWLRARAARAFAEALVRRYKIALRSPTQPVQTLSGGNQQRVLVARALACEPRVLIAVHPTRGLDIAATAYVHHTLAAAAADGTAILLISTDLDELDALADRIVVLYRGALSAPVAPGARARIGALMAGLTA